ncbi:MAG TPA: ABC transporter permease subunit [Bacillales bacterium]|nr:ABC transporter permease subunit [Bacillales bacterium]
MLKLLVKKPLFLIGATFIILLVTASLIQEFVYDGYVPSEFLHYSDKGELLAKSPLTPAQHPPFGTDESGFDIFYMVILGAKYTLGIAFVVAGLRLAISVVLGLLYGNYFIQFKKYIAGLVDAFYYMPVALVAILLLRGSGIMFSTQNGFNSSVLERGFLEIVILTLIAIPTTSLLIGNETSLILRNEFITGARVMGGSRFHIIRRHVLPHLAPKLWIQYVQQVIQVLVLLVHLGLFHLFFGGTIKEKLPFINEVVYRSSTGEWAGLIGHYYHLLRFFPWLPLVPLFAFAFTILAMNFILEALKSAMAEKNERRTRLPSTEKENPTKPVHPIHPSFEPVYRSKPM